MTPEEQMRVILDWVYSFTTNSPGSWSADDLYISGEGWLGHLEYYYSGIATGVYSQFIGPYPDEASLIQESYNRVYYLVWGLVHDT